MSRQLLNLSYYPALLEDELLSSYLTRLAAFNGLGGTRFYEYFFGKPQGVPVIDLPGNLILLQRRLGTNSPFSSVADLMQCATIYPYHRVFLHPEIDRKVMFMLRGSSQGPNYPKATLGRLANNFGANPTLRYCHICVQHDYKHLGCPYWHRIHQLPGIVACIHHACILEVMKSPFGQEHRTQLLLPPMDKLSYRSPQPCQGQIEFAVLSTQLLLSKLSSHDPLARANVYRCAALSFGFIKNGRINIAALGSEMKKFYNDFCGFQHRERLLSSTTTPLAWLYPLFNRPHRSCHPICHLLLIRFLFGSIENFVSALATSDVPNVQLNTDHPRPSANASVTALISDITRSCRTIAAELGISVTTAVLLRRELGIDVKERVKTIDKEKVSQIVEAIQAGLSVAKVAEKCGVSICTVYRLRRIHHLQDHIARARKFGLEREKRRDEWSTAMSANKHGGINYARSKAQAAYAWLYRNDRNWLRDKCSGTTSPQRKSTKVDWKKRDSELCEKLRCYVDTLKDAHFRQRISRSLMLCYIRASIVRLNHLKLPKTSSLLDELEESIFENHKRKIDFYLKHVGNAGSIPPAWKIQRSCGIRKWTESHDSYLAAKYSK